MPFAFIRFLRGNPARPDNSLPGGGGEGGDVDNSLPGDQPGIDNSLPGGPPDYATPGPIVPPLPGIWPAPGVPTLPIRLPPGGIALPPIYIDGKPDNSLPLPPAGTIHPPLPDNTLPPTMPNNDKVALLVKIIGLPGVHWIVVEKPPIINPIPPPQPQPKR